MDQLSLIDELPAARADDPPNSHAAAAAMQPNRRTRAGKVLTFLRERQGQWVAGYMLTTPFVGGSEGLKRLRELRQVGHSIEARRTHGTTWEYRLA